MQDVPYSNNQAVKFPSISDDIKAIVSTALLKKHCGCWHASSAGSGVSSRLGGDDSNIWSSHYVDNDFVPKHCPLRH